MNFPFLSFQVEVSSNYRFYKTEDLLGKNLKPIPWSYVVNFDFDKTWWKSEIYVIFHYNFSLNYVFAGQYFKMLSSYLNINNHFNFHICLSFVLLLLLCPSECVCLKTCSNSCSSITKFHKWICLVCVMSENYAFWVILRLLGSIRQGKAKLRALDY